MRGELGTLTGRKRKRNFVSPRGYVISSILFITDIDECSSGRAVCHLNSECVNTFGGAYCRCLPGYEYKRGKCRGK